MANFGKPGKAFILLNRHTSQLHELLGGIALGSIKGLGSHALELAHEMYLRAV